MRLSRLALVLVVFAALFAACDREGQVLNISMTDYGYSGVPATITGGAVEVNLKNVGQATHEAVFLDIGDTSFGKFKKEFPAIFEGAPFPSFLKAATGAGGEIPAGKTYTGRMTLPKGNYLLVCALDDAPGAGEETTKLHYDLGMHKNVTVEGPEDVDLEAPGGTFKTVNEYEFVAPKGLSAGDKEYAFFNEGPKEWHFLDFSLFPAGTTPQQAEEAFGTLLTLPQDQPPPEGLPLPEGDSVVITGPASPGNGQTFRANFQSGRTYLLACFIPDLAGGPPHAISHRMYKAFTVQ